MELKHYHFSLLRFIADNPNTDISVIETEFSKVFSVKNKLVFLEKIFYIDRIHQRYTILDAGKNYLNSKMGIDKKSKMRDFSGNCNECSIYSTKLSYFKSDYLCPNCLNKDDYDPVFKGRSMIDYCRFV